MSLFLLAITPGVTIAITYYLVDKYNREPLGLLLKVFIISGLMVIPAGFIEEILSGLNIFGGIIGTAVLAFLIVALTEEWIKRFVVLKFAYNNPAFDEKLDGIIYCVFSALGFATIENIFYVMFSEYGGVVVGILRSVLSVPAHMLFGVSMGYYLSMAKIESRSIEKKKHLLNSILVPVLLHGIYDFILMTEYQIFLLLFIPFVIYMWIVNMKKIKEYVTDSKENSVI